LDIVLQYLMSASLCKRAITICVQNVIKHQLAKEPPLPSW